MKRIVIITLLVIITFSCFSQQQGHVFLQNSNKTPLPGVEILVNGLSPTTSSSDGSFVIQTGTLKPGSKLIAQVSKVGYTVVNKKEVEQWAFSPQKTFTVIMCSQKDFDNQCRHYYNIGQDYYKSKYLQTVNALNQAVRQSTITEGQRMDSLRLAQEKYQAAINQLNYYVEFFARINNDDLSLVDSKALNYFNRGLIDSAIAVYESARLFEQFSKQKSELEKNSNDIESLIPSLRYYAQMCVFAGGRENILKAGDIIQLIAAAFPDEAQTQLEAGDFFLSTVMDYNKALAYFEKTLSLVSNDNMVVLDCYAYIGNSYVQLSEYDKAYNALESALRIIEHSDLKRSEKASMVYNNLGLYYSQIGNKTKALEYFEKSAYILKSLNINNAQIGLLYSNIGCTYDELSQYDKALFNCLEAEKITLSTLGNENMQMAFVHNNKALIYQHVFQYDSAYSEYQKALDITEATFGTIHPMVAKIYSSSSLIFNEIGNYPYAIRLLDTAIYIQEQLYEENHPDFIYPYNNLGLIYCKLGDYGKAYQAFQKVAKIIETKFNGDHPFSCTLLNNVGAIYSALNEREKAITYYQASIDAGLKHYGENHADVARSYMNRGVDYIIINDVEKGKTDISKALKIYEKIYGDNHPDLALCYYNSGFAYGKIGKYDMAYSEICKAVSIWEKAFPQGHPYIGQAYMTLGDIFDITGKTERSIKEYDKAIASYVKCYGDNNISTVQAIENKGDILLSAKRFAEAIGEYNKALSIRKQIVSEDDSTIADDYHRIATCYYLSQDNNNARGNFEKALSIYDMKGIVCENVFHDNQGLGWIYIQDEQYEKAIARFENANKLIPALKDKDTIKESWELKSLLRNLYYNKTDDYSSALVYALQENQILREHFSYDKENLLISYKMLGNIYFELTSYDTAMFFYQKALEIAENMKRQVPEHRSDLLLSIGYLYEKLGHYENALRTHTDNLETISKASFDGKTDNQLLLCNKIYDLYCKIRNQKDSMLNEELQNEMHEFFNNTIITGRVFEGTSAYQKGLRGDVYILEFNDWNCVEEQNVFDVIKTTQNGQKKYITVMFNNKVVHYEFEGLMGIRFDVTPISPLEKQQIINTYQEWKKKQ